MVGDCENLLNPEAREGGGRVTPSWHLQGWADTHQKNHNFLVGKKT